MRAACLGGPAVGAALRQCPVTIVERGQAKEGHLTDLVAPRFTAFYFSEEGVVPAELDAAERSLTELRVPFKLIPVTRRLMLDMGRVAAWDHTGRLFPMYEVRSGSLDLVRPDGHLLARWQEARASGLSDAVKQTLNPS